MVQNHLFFNALLFRSILILVLTKNSIGGFPHPDCSLQIRFDPIYLPHPTDCRKFYECDLGLAYEFQCPLDLHFNVYLNGCDFPESTRCRNDYRKFQKASEKPTIRTTPTEHPITTELNDPSTKISPRTKIIQTSQEKNSVNRVEVLRLSNISELSSHRAKISRSPNLDLHPSTTSSKYNDWKKSTKVPKEETRKSTLGKKPFFFPNVASTVVKVPEQRIIASWTKHQDFMASTKPRDETVSRTTRSIGSKYRDKKKNSRLDNKIVALEEARTTPMSRVELGDMKKMHFVGSVTNSPTVGENSVLNKMPANRKDWTKMNALKWKKTIKSTLVVGQK